MTIEHASPSRRVSQRLSQFAAALTPTNNALIRRRSRAKWLRIQLILILVCIGILSFVFWRQVYQQLELLLEFIEQQPILGCMIIFAIFAIFPVLCIPAYVVAVAAGYIYYLKFRTFGLVMICIVFWLGTSVGAVLAFINARYLCTDCTAKLTNKHLKFRIIQQLAQDNSFKVVLAIRLAPIPFVLVNYILGSTNVKIKAHTFGNITLIPRSILYPLFGSTIGSLSDAAKSGQDSAKNPASLGLFVLGIVVTTIASVYFTFIAKREIRRLIDEQGLNTASTYTASNSNVMNNNSNSNSENPSNIELQIVIPTDHDPRNLAIAI